MSDATRRRYLQAIAGVGTALLAGCSADSPSTRTDQPTSAVTDGTDRPLGSLRAAGDWPMRYADPANTGHSGMAGPHEDVSIVWRERFETEAIREVIPVVSDGRIYASCYGDGSLVAFDPADESVVWRYDAPETGSSPAVVGPPDDRLVVVGGERGLHAVDAETGDRRWLSPGPFTEEHKVFGGNELVFADSRDGVHAIDAARGTGRWALENYQLGAVDGGVAVLGLASGDLSGHVLAVDAQTGRERWRADNTTLHGAASILDGVVYVAVTGRLFAFDLADGRVQWVVRENNEVFETPVVTDDTVVVGSVLAKANQGGNLYAFERETGARRWHVDLGERNVYPGAIDSDVVYVAANELVQARSLSDGSVVWSHAGSFTNYESIAIVEDVLIAGTENSRFDVFAGQ